MTRAVGTPSGAGNSASPQGRSGPPARLRVERVWTTEGVHPYDEVTWERRDVVMTNWRDGSVNFEQRGVEFPNFWSINATNIVTTKYFRGAVGTPQRETTLRQLIDRVVRTYRRAGEQYGYFATPEDAEIFDHELTWMLLHQVFSFNSPVWFNVGTSSKAQVSACFILSVDDSMDSILDWYKEEGLIFQGGSGSGVNLSRIRGSKELLSSGGTASGPVSFMRGADASAGTIKSGGATRRAAKMVILDVDHPDIEEFIATKAREEDKIRALRDAGFDMDLGGKDIVSVQYQNANNSVRVSDEFMRAVEDGATFDLVGRLDGGVIETVHARKLFRTMAQAAWECADPGIQYDGAINDWHTNPETGRITASNPCFTAETLVHTDKGLIRFDELIDRARHGEAFGIYTHDATNNDAPADRVELTTPTAFMVTGTNEIVRLEFSNGMVLRCTPDHRIWTTNRGYVEARDLTETDRILPLSLPTPASAASYGFALRPGTQVQAGSTVRNRRGVTVLPEKWTEEFAHLLGWLTGDGSLRRGERGVRGSYDNATWIYSAEDRDQFLDRHRSTLANIVGFSPKPSEQPNGTVQLRATRSALVEFLSGLGVTTDQAARKRVPSAVLQAPAEIQAQFLRGLFDSDGCAVQTSNGTRYVGLGSVSVELLRDVQRVLGTFGVSSRIYTTRAHGDATFEYTTIDGEHRLYSGGQLYDLRISGENVAAFAREIGFDHARKAARLAAWLANNRFYRTDQTACLVTRVFDGFETTYNLSEPRNHSYIANGIVVRNCSEYMSLDNSSCNLASLNLMKFRTADGGFDIEMFVRSVELIITAMDISISFADFPTQKIAETTRAYRQLGIGYANLGALLMASGLPYDSDAGRSVAAAITSLMTSTAYRRSAELAGVVGPYDGYARNAEAHKRVMRKHAAANDEIKPHSLAAPITREATKQWHLCLTTGEQNGYRNAQASLLAPTGCLTPDTLVTTDRGLMRLGEIGEVYGDRWQDLSLRVSTDEGERQATKFFVNDEEPTRRIVTTGGYSIQGTLAHRIKIVDSETGAWVWKRLADIEPGDVLPMQMGTLVGAPRRVPLPMLDQAYYAGDRTLHVPDAVGSDLAELVGYFMGDGSLHAKGVRLCVADTDLDVVERLRVLSKGLFGLEPVVTAQRGYHEVTLQSVRLARWWHAAGFAKGLPSADHVGKGWTPRVPSAVLEANDAAIYAAFLRGLYEADGSVTDHVPALSTSSGTFAGEVRALLLSLGIATTTRTTTSGWGESITQLRVRNLDHALLFDEAVGFLSERKSRLLPELTPTPKGYRRDRVFLPRQVWDELVPVGHESRNAALLSLGRTGGVSRFVARRVFEETADARLGEALRYLYEPVAANEDGGVQPTYDLSVPENLTYVANGFVSHNTIGLAMDCDTTGIEPDLALVKYKKLVGGGSMQIVNQTVPSALHTLGYQEEQVEAVVEYIAEHGHVVNAPGLRHDHYAVFDCAMGERSIAAMGHVRMMAATQPFLSGAISKCVTGDTLIATADGLVRIGSLHKGESEDTFREERLEIASLDGFRKTDAFYYGGVRPVRRVRLRSGHTITGTLPHRLLVAAPDGLTWRTLGEINEGDAVAVQYGADLWSPLPASLRHIAVSSSYGNQKAVRLPVEMTHELAFLLGAYASEGHTTRSTWTVTITNSVPAVLERVRDAWQSQFGLTARVSAQPGKCPDVVVSSKAVVEFLDALGCGSRASDKRIPDAVLTSSREMVIAFLRGLALDAYVTFSTAPRWAICLDSPRLLDDLQAVLTNLGIVHGRVSKHDTTYDKRYGEVYAAGRQGQLLASMVPFLEPDKAARAAEFLQQRYATGTADVVPGISGRELYELIPEGRPGRHGVRSHRRGFAFLRDDRTRQVTRETLERVASIPGVDLPVWLRQVLDGNLHLSPVASVEDIGEAAVFDLSVPVTHAFVANGIMNHNTVNMPESATVEDIEYIYMQGWKLGLKALAIYRDNCKVGQPLSNAKSKKDVAEKQPEKVIEYRPMRKRLPKKRPSQTVSFTVSGAKGYLTASSYPDDGLGEVFLKMSKQGSTLAGVMDAFSVAISIGLQYGVPLETYVGKFTNMRFEPAGMTDDPDIRMAASVVDYIFRRLALDFLPLETRADLGIFTAAERAAQARAETTGDDVDLAALAASAPIETKPTAPRKEPALAARKKAVETVQNSDSDAPLCFTCGTKMRPAGSCYVCEGCGSTSGCS
jgi:ribonucleotide reductase alpha subunit